MTDAPRNRQVQDWLETHQGWHRPRDIADDMRIPTSDRAARSSVATDCLYLWRQGRIQRMRITGQRSVYAAL